MARRKRITGRNAAGLPFRRGRVAGIAEQRQIPPNIHFLMDIWAVLARQAKRSSL